MNNYITIIIIILLLFLFSEDKDFITNLTKNKLLIFLIAIYFIYNNIHFIFLLGVILFIILSNEKTRNKVNDIFQSSNLKDKILNEFDINRITDYIKNFLKKYTGDSEINKNNSQEKENIESFSQGHQQDEYYPVETIDDMDNFDNMDNE